MIIGNELIKLQKLDDYHFLIVADHEVGKVGINADNELEVFINKDDQGRHYASNAVYLFDKYLHETLKIDIINAKVKKENDIYRHVVEHCGYHKQKEDDVCFYYIHQVAKTIKDDCRVNDEHHNAIYLCGGCFWGVEKAFGYLDGVVETKAGYANGTLAHPSYEDIIRNHTGFKECVKVIYDQRIIELETILKAYFYLIDPSQSDGQGEDIGEQYQCAIYYLNETTGKEVRDYLAKEKEKHPSFHVEVNSIKCFYLAEDYHQNYLETNPQGYCHINRKQFALIKGLNSNKQQSDQSGY